MNNQLKGTVTLINDRVKFSCISRDNQQIAVDYTKPIGDEEGYTSLELFLLSLAACSGTAVAILLRKMGKDLSGLKVNVEGERRTEHPTYFERIALHFELKSKDAQESDLEKAIVLSEKNICPVWNMIKDIVKINYNFKIIRIH